MTTESSPEAPSSSKPQNPAEARGVWSAILGFFIANKLVVALLMLGLITAGIAMAPFRYDAGVIPRDPVPVDAIPDIGENQQIVFTKWPGRSPRDVEDQVTYPLTTALLGIPGVRTVRSFSMFGFSSIYVIFEDDVEFYWSRSRILEKLASLPGDTLPEGATPTLGPDATALGQVFWYTLEARDRDGAPVQAFSQDELRSVQDWMVRFALQGVDGVAEVASVGGYVKEYQIDLDPEAMLAHGVDIMQIADAVRKANMDVGARTVEINRVEYIVRGIGFVRDIADLEQIVVANRQHTPIRIRDVATVATGPAQRRGALDVEGAPAVGGVVVARFGANPLEVIENVKDRIDEIGPGLPSKTLEDGRVAHIEIVPFYDRTTLIDETLETLFTALTQQILITVIVVIVMLRHLRSSLLVSAILPLGVLGAFIGMKAASVDANIMALSGIAIAIGTMVDMGIVLTENIVTHLRSDKTGARLDVVRRAAAEVAPAVLTSTATTVVSFLPIFGLTAAEGKLFTPLAFTKTFAMIAALVIALFVLPALAHLFLRRESDRESGSPRLNSIRGRLDLALDGVLLLLGLLVVLFWSQLWGAVIVLLAGGRLLSRWLPARFVVWIRAGSIWLIVVAVAIVLADDWLPLGPSAGAWLNRIFVAGLIALLLGAFHLFLRFFPAMLGACLRHAWIPGAVFVGLLLWGLLSWRGGEEVTGWLRPERAAESDGAGEQTDAPDPGPTFLEERFPGLGREYMPPLDEGSFLYMPTTMPHASMGEALDQLSELDQRIASVPEVDKVVGKLGRVESPLDPAPISMYETIVTYLPEYRLDERGRRTTFRYDDVAGEYERDEAGELIADPDGRPYRQWREHIHSPSDIWTEIQRAAEIPGVTSAPELMPIAARIVMLQSGMRAPMGVKIRGPDLDTIERVGLELERHLKQVPSIRADTVVADRIVGKPYIEIVIDREAIARHGIAVHTVQAVIQTAIGGQTLTKTVEGRERYAIRVRYPRERRESPEMMQDILVPSPLGHQLPLGQLAAIRYVRGPQVIKSEDTFLTGYVVFDKVENAAEVDVVEEAEAFLEAKRKSGELQLPAGVSYRFAGNYENQLRSTKTLSVLVPVAFFIIFLLIYFQFRRVTTTLIIFSGVALAMAGGFILLWAYGQPWFLDASPGDIDLRTLFQVDTVNLSVAVWVGFIALVGIATDNGVVLATYLHQRIDPLKNPTREEIRRCALDAATRRARPCLMASATTILALLPVITSSGRGSDVMMPMALPSLGGMAVTLFSLFLVPVLFARVEEARQWWQRGQLGPSAPDSNAEDPPSPPEATPSLGKES